MGAVGFEPLADSIPVLGRSEAFSSPDVADRPSMAKLITNHDPFHIHKSLGVFALLHFIYRYYLLVTEGTLFAEGDTTNRGDLAGVVLHGLLSCSSLLLPIPSKRNFSSPMIWPEFRLHSISFALRHTISTVLALLHAWPAHWILNALAKLMHIIIVVKAAS